MGEVTLLQYLEGTFELLLLLSKAAVSFFAGDFSSQVLGNIGKVHEGQRRCWELEEKSRKSTVLKKIPGEEHKLRAQATCPRNRRELLELIVDDLWCLSLPWTGAYDNGRGGVVRLSVDPQQHAIDLMPQAGAPPGSLAGLAAPCRGSLAGGVLVVPRGARGDLRGHFDGRCITWEHGEVWTRRAQAGRPADDEVLRLVLPQLALALRWLYGEFTRLF